MMMTMMTTTTSGSNSNSSKSRDNENKDKDNVNVNGSIFPWRLTFLLAMAAMLVVVMAASLLLLDNDNDGSDNADNTTSTSSGSSGSSIFHRGTSNVQWCEDVLTRQQQQQQQEDEPQLQRPDQQNQHEVYHIAEFYNTTSNAFFVWAAVLGLWRVLSNSTTLFGAGKHNNNNSSNNNTNTIITIQNTPAFVIAELIMMIGIGFGSALFHSHQSRVAQYSDEFPMCCLLVAYKFCMKDSHPLTSGRYAIPFYTCNVLAVAIVWAVYVQTGIYEVFVVAFTVQVLVMTVLAFGANENSGSSSGTTTTTTTTQSPTKSFTLSRPS
mmetsp:Transcript_69595/g.105103  ORF Transcript_69595/g.105103 Transcript_69595/m.105103 type:complete len:323 (+) Transcript_69595:3-971(+)